MTDLASLDAHGALIEPATLQIQRLLPGPIERAWRWLTDSDLRRRWLAAGEMELTPGSTFELIWRNDELSDSPSARPAHIGPENRVLMQMIEVDPPHSLSFEWPGAGEVTWALEPQGDEVLFTLTHRRANSRSLLLGVSSGWHMHLDILAAKATGRRAPSFWDGLPALRADYDRRFPA